jgi:hypothetical protein
VFLNNGGFSYHLRILKAKPPRNFFRGGLFYAFDNRQGAR